MSLPEGWREMTLGEVCENISRRFDFPSKKEVVFINTGDVLAGKFLHKDYISKEGLPGQAKKAIKKGDILYSEIRPKNKRYAIVDFDVDDFVVSTKFMVLKKNDKIDLDFLYLFVTSEKILKEFNQTAESRSGTFPQITFDAVKHILINLPPLQEQKAIANMLSSFDEKIELLKEQNETLEQMAQGVFREWFVDGVDESWEVCRLGDYVKTNIATLKKNDNLEMIQYLDTASLTEGQISSYQLLNINDAPSRAKRKVEHLDILISTVRPDQKHYGIVRNPDDNIIVSTGYCVLNCHKINPYFVYLFLTSKQMTEYLHNIAEGSTSTYPSLKPIDIENLEFNLPSSEKLESFFDIADSIWEKIDSNYEQIQTLQKIRDTLLPKLMSGEVRVGGDCYRTD